jgi:hypothetical protein
VPEESQVESCEHQNNTDIRDQPLPESISEEHDIYADYDGYHGRHVKRGGYLFAHFRQAPNLKLQDGVGDRCTGLPLPLVLSILPFSSRGPFWIGGAARFCTIACIDSERNPPEAIARIARGRRS